LKTLKANEPRLTRRDVKLAVLIGIVGYLFNSRTWLLFLNGLNPIQGTIVYYVIVYAGLYGLAKLGLSIFGFKISTADQTFGLLMLNFAFHVTTNWSSPWVQYVTTGSLVGMSNVLVNNSEDGLVWYVVYTLGGITNLFWARLLTFTVIPVLISMVALYLIKGKPVLVP
jgi:hypothetical protein